jgi:hypothetical protein
MINEHTGQWKVYNVLMFKPSYNICYSKSAIQWRREKVEFCFCSINTCQKTKLPCCSNLTIRKMTVVAVVVVEKCGSRGCDCHQINYVVGNNINFCLYSGDLRFKYQSGDRLS